MAKMGEIFDNRTVHFHIGSWSGKYLAEISEADWCLYWNKSFYHHMYCYFRKRVEQVVGYGHVWTYMADFLRLS